MAFARRINRYVMGLSGALLVTALAAPVAAQEVTVLCNFEVDWCEALKATYEKTTGQKAVFIRRTDGESLAQIRAERSNPRADVYHAAESASAKQLASEGLLEAYKSPYVAELHDWAQRIAEENKYFQTPIYTGVLGWGYNTELLAKKKLPEPKCWADLVNPAYKDEIQMANPGTSGTAFNTVSTVLQMMGEDAGFKFLAAMNKNVNQYTRSGSAGIRAAAKGETLIGITFLHDSVAQTVQGYPIKTIAPCEGTGYEIISSSIIKNGPNPEGAKKWMDFVLSPAGQNVALTVAKFQIPSNKNAQAHPMAPKAAEVKLIKLDLDKYGSKEGRERLLTRWENEVFKAPK
ncbi:MAG: ABC transporter substrate-binding protein [Betaproteobacteria bacterium]